MKNRKRKLLFPFLIVCMLLMGMNVCAEEMEFPEEKSLGAAGFELTPDAEYAVPVEEKAQSGKSFFTTDIVTGASNSELDPPQKWTVQISRSMIEGVMTDSTVSDECYWSMIVYKSTDTKMPCNWVSGTLADSELSMNIESLEDGEYYLTLWRGDIPGSTKVSNMKTYRFCISESEAYFYSDWYLTEETVLKQVTERMDPAAYNKVPEFYYTNSYAYKSELSNIVKTAEKLTEKCETDEAKLQAVHDWICTSVAYDYTVLNDGSAADISARNNPFYVYKNQRGICGGYARLMQIMMTSVGVPCVYIEGFGEDGTSSNKTNHAWNMVWIDEAWRAVDVTWDCRNEYTDENLTERTQSYAYYAEPTFFFGSEHRSHYRYTYQYVASISVATAPKKVFEKGDKFSVGDGDIRIVYGDGSEKIIRLTSSMCSGYDMSEYGQQAVTVSYAGAKVRYAIHVVPKEGSTHTVGNIKYRITKAATSNGTVEVDSVKNAESIVVPQTVTIKGYKFKVTSIAAKAFEDCKKLKKLTIESTVIKKVANKAFLGIQGTAKIYVPEKKYEAYKKLMEDKGQTSKVTIKKS